MKLKPLTRGPADRPVASLDVQGDVAQGMVIATLCTDDGEASYTKPEDLIKAMTTRQMRGRYIYSHRLTYDAGVLIPWLPDDTTLLFIGENMFKGRLTESGKHKVYLGNSNLLWGGLSLSRLAAEVGMLRLPAPETLIRRGGQTEHPGPCGKCDKGGIQDFSGGEARIVKAAMEMLRCEIRDLGSELRLTLPSTAMALFRYRYLDDEYWTPFLYRNDFARRAYYGGRCEPYVLGWWDCVNVYDYHSHYPAQMLAHEYPNPNTMIGPRRPGRLSRVMDFEGCSECTVEVPNMKYPPLPYRVGQSTFYPTGEFRGVWCHNELRYAISLGVKVKKVWATLYSETTCRPFADYVSDLWQRRQELKAQGSKRALIYKLLLNSLAGKFGQREEGGLRELRSMESYWKIGPKRGTEFLELRRTVYAKVPLATKRLPSYIIVPWAAYVTAYGRIALHQAMLETPGPITYVDTDSIHCFSDLPIGEGLGDLALQMQGCYVDYIAPKMYSLATGDGEHHAVAKGIPYDLQSEYCTYREVEYWKAVGWQEAVRMKLDPSTWVVVKKRMMLAQPKRRYTRIPGWKSDCWISEPYQIDSAGRLR